MANKNNKKEGKITAGELFDRLKSKKNEENEAYEVRFDGERGGKHKEGATDGFSESEFSENGFSIDATSKSDSDSELDINELLKKYMPEYDGGDGVGLPVITAEEVGALEDERFNSALDSAFGPEDSENLSSLDFSLEEEVGVGCAEAVIDEEIVPSRKQKKEKKEKKRFSLFGSRKKRDEEDDVLELMEEMTEVPASEPEPADEVMPAPEPEESIEPTEEFAPPVLPKDDVNFHTTDLRLGDLAKLETILNEPQPGNRITPETKAVKSGEDELLKRLEELELASVAAGATEQVPVADDDMFAGEEYALPALETEDTAAALSDSEETVSEEEVAAAAEEIDPTDLNLRVAFGLDEDEKKADSAAAKEFGDKLEELQYKREKRVKLDRPEFVDKTQIPRITKEYKGRLIGLWIKLGLALLFAVALLWFENISFFTGLFTGDPQQFAGVFDPAVYPVVYIMTSLQLMLLACICAHEQILNGFKYIIRGIPKAESALSFMTVLAVIYSAVLARVIDVPNEPVMFNFVIALCAVMSLIYAIYNTKREKMNFEVISSKKPKHIVRCLPDEEAACEAQAFMEQTDACDVMKIEKTDFIDGFFGRIHQPDPTVNVYMSFLMSIALALGVLVGFFVNLRGGSAADVMSAGFVTLLVACPLSILVAFSYPFYRATLAAKEYESAIIGESSLTEYSNASIISFDDKNVFPSYSVKIQNIKIFNNARVDRVLYYAASVFAYAGGPLQDVFEVTTLDMGHSEDVKIFDTEAGFLATQVNGVNIIFGNYKTLTAKGFHIPVEYASDDVDFSSELSVMYMFREDKLFAKMYIKYVMDGDIDLILKQFQGTGLYVCVRTFDPNIDERMIAKKLNMKKIPLKVVRYASTEEVTMYEAKVDSGLVTGASPKSLLQIISYCDKVLHTRKASIALSVLSVIIGIAIVGLLILSDTMGIANSLFVALYHLFWVIPAVISAKMFIR